MELPKGSEAKAPLSVKRPPHWTLNCSLAKPVHAKAQVKTSQAVRHFHGPLSKESTTQELLVGAMFHLLVSETCCSCCCAPAYWHPQHQGSESDRGYAEAGLAAGICGRALLTGRSASGLFSKEPKQCLCCTDTPSDVLIPSRATAVTGLCWQMLPEHRTSSVRWDATRHTLTVSSLRAGIGGERQFQFLQEIYLCVPSLPGLLFGK